MIQFLQVVLCNLPCSLLSQCSSNSWYILSTSISMPMFYNILSFRGTVLTSRLKGKVETVCGLSTRSKAHEMIEIIYNHDGYLDSLRNLLLISLAR